MPTYFEFDVSLQEIQPRIWRRFWLRTSAKFSHLHQAIQDSFGWLDGHLFEFKVPTSGGAVIAGIPDDDFNPSLPDAKHVKLKDYFSGKSRTEWCEYTYDFGDNWVHEVKLVDLLSFKERFTRRLLQGALACPPEDCGGPPGYERMAHFVATGEDLFDDSDVDLAAWIGDWDPTDFDIKAARADFDK